MNPFDKKWRVRVTYVREETTYEVRTIVHALTRDIATARAVLRWRHGLRDGDVVDVFTEEVKEKVRTIDA